MKSISEFINESTRKRSIKSVNDLEKFLELFSDNADSWRDATDEVRDIARTAREYLEELDNIKVEPVNFKAIKTPAEWNTNGKKFIADTVSKMSKDTLSRFLKEIDSRFAY